MRKVFSSLIAWDMYCIEGFKYDIVVAIQVLSAQKVEQLKVELLSEVEEPYRKVKIHFHCLLLF